MLVEAAVPHRRVVGYFSVLARVRHLLPQARAVLGHTTLVDLDVIHEAAGMCNLTLEWRSFDPEDVSQLEHILGDIRGDVFVAGDGIPDHGLRVFQQPYRELASLQCEIELDNFDAVLVGVTDPVVALIHHDVLCASLRCPQPQGAPEDPRELEHQLRQELEQRRRDATARLPPSLLRGVAALLENNNLFASAVKYVAAELPCSLADAARIVRLLKPWWPGGLPDSKGIRVDERR